ncbi:TetR/AcrR family transcriptional regulator [Chitinophaga qingshengii]|uniref:TetR/AcrR family transcriptional regulator n=1 Tax=Chitinophaga qingshengii TaxID=1569794 RepID=A0ABR7TV49_9BACT|nr:TetR/AcrR family transcriptional regulator [Chitinophaga qingshengii]MBC9933269.1 TetR/AcrR family transcriptional regulator [Chitinophaga qingshengii]
MAGRNRIFDEEEVIRKATAVFWERGYEATSTEDLLTAMGIGKGSFYNAFPGGKQELFEKALEQFNTRAFTKLKAAVAADDDPLSAVLAFFRDIAQESRAVHMKGCFMGNTIAELSHTEPALEKKAVQRLQQMEQLFTKVIKEAQQSGRLKTTTPAPLLARHLVNLWNGLNITRRMYPQASGLSELIALNLAPIF